MSESKADLDLTNEMESLGLPLTEDASVRCVFSTMETINVGTGTTTQKHDSKQYCYVEHLEDRKFSVRPVNQNYLPSGESKTISLEELMDKYVPELEYLESNTIPAMEQQDEHLDDGDADREEGKLYSAEGHYSKALIMDQENVRALFSLGLVYLEMKDKKKSRDMMKNILEVKTAFDGKNEHLFNEFGMKLRKTGMFDEAVEYYTKATQYVKHDQNLYYNLARANYERDNWEACVNALGMCYSIDPKMKASNDLFSIILRLDKKPELCEQIGKPPVPKTVIDHIRDIYRGKDPYLLENEAENAGENGDVPEDPLASKEKEDNSLLKRARKSKKGKKSSAGEFNFNMD